LFRKKSSQTKCIPFCLRVEKKRSFVSKSKSPIQLAKVFRAEASLLKSCILARKDRVTVRDMEALAERRINGDEQREQRSFNPCASVKMVRDDLRLFGEVTSDTIERIYDTELSLLVEGLDRAACTSFVLKREGDDLVYYKNGSWESYTSMLLVGREVAELEAKADLRKQFLHEDAITDLAHGYKMRGLKPGEQHVWSSPYRYDIEGKYGREFMSSCGRFPDRAMGFLYHASCDEDGNVTLQSQTVDKSDDDAFGAALDLASKDPHVDKDMLVAAYDDVLLAKHGKEHYAGRTNAEIKENAWDQLQAQRDLIEYFISGIERIARNTALQGNALEETAKRHMYGVWAAFKKRFDGGDIIKLTPTSETPPIVHWSMVSDEVNLAFNQFASAGVAMVGCGGEIKILRGEGAILSASAEDVFDAFFGTKPKPKAMSDKFGSLSFYCPNGHENERPRNKLVSHCQSCGVGVGCGEVLSKRDEQKTFKQRWDDLIQKILGDELSQKDTVLAA
jgi:hypothetical protein